ncbi:MAG: histidine phosphatase family protein [Pseudobdellovibrio sp.]
MNIVLFRHGQKGLIPFEDPHLTEDGFKQSEAIALMVLNGKLPKPSKLWASEKIRTSQTFQALSKKFEILANIKPELNLRSDLETQKAFRERAESLINYLSNLASTTASENESIYLCSHYDWIEEAMLLIPSDTDLTSSQFSHWGPAQFIHFNAKNNIWHFIKKGLANK